MFIDALDGALPPALTQALRVDSALPEHTPYEDSRASAGAAPSSATHHWPVRSMLPAQYLYEVVDGHCQPPPDQYAVPHAQLVGVGHGEFVTEPPAATHTVLVRVVPLSHHCCEAGKRIGRRAARGRNTAASPGCRSSTPDRLGHASQFCPTSRSPPGQLVHGVSDGGLSPASTQTVRLRVVPLSHHCCEAVDASPGADCPEVRHAVRVTKLLPEQTRYVSVVASDGGLPAWHHWRVTKLLPEHA